MNQDEADAILIAAVNRRVQRGRRVARGDIERPRFTPPRCGRPGCTELADISERDYTGTRPYFCGMGCFRLVRQFTTESEQSLGVLPDLRMYPLWVAWKTELKGLGLLEDVARDARVEAGKRLAALRRRP